MTSLIEVISLIHIQSYLWTGLVLVLVMSTLSSKFFSKVTDKFIKNYDNVQRIHHEEVSRLGGVALTFGVLMLAYLSDNPETQALTLKLFIALTPITLVALMEDLHLEISPFFRLSVLLLSSFLVLLLTDIELPKLNEARLDLLLSMPYLGLFFYSLCIAGLINGMNFIDGTNGNFGFTSIAILMGLLFLGMTANDLAFISLLLTFLMPLIIFMAFNYPLGKIFAGDVGAYFFGASIGFLVIYFFGSHPEISAWNAVLIVFYPAMELIYSVTRKVAKNYSPLLPDRHHLHIKLYGRLFNLTQNAKTSNNLVTLMLSPFWLLPMLLLPWVYHSAVLSMSTATALALLYIVLNKVIRSPL